jgi:hypothetical protein
MSIYDAQKHECASEVTVVQLSLHLSNDTTVCLDLLLLMCPNQNIQPVIVDVPKLWNNIREVTHSLLSYKSKGTT